MGITQQIGASSLIKPGVIDNTAARPASPYEGQVIFQKDTDQLLVWNGTTWVIPNTVAQTSAFGSWQSWSPTITADGGTFASTVVTNARYTQINKTVICTLDVKVTGVGSAAGRAKNHLFKLGVNAFDGSIARQGGTEIFVARFGICGHFDK